MMILSTKRNGANYTFASFLLVLAFANYIFANDIHNFAFSRNLLDFANCVFAFIIETHRANTGGALRHTPLCSMFNVHVLKKEI